MPSLYYILLLTVGIRWWGLVFYVQCAVVIVVKDPGFVQVYICIYYIGSLIFNCLLWFIRTSVGVHVVGFGILSIFAVVFEVGESCMWC